MRSSRIAIMSMVLALIAALFSGCGHEEYTTEVGMNFYKEMYYDEKSHKEQPLQLEDGCFGIDVHTSRTSGTIHLEVVDEDNADLVYVYDLDDEKDQVTTNIRIEPENRDDNWVMKIDIDENTEGKVKLVFHIRN